MGIKYRLWITNDAAPLNGEVGWGFIVARNPTTTSDLDPIVHEHLSWMEWSRTPFVAPAANTFVPLVGGGDDGFRTVRSRRKLNEIEDDLLFCIVATTASTFIYEMISTVAIMLP